MVGYENVDIPVSILTKKMHVSVSIFNTQQIEQQTMEYQLSLNNSSFNIIITPD